VARANALENNVSLYYTQRGKRITIKYVDAPVPPKVWHTLRVEFAAGTSAWRSTARPTSTCRTINIKGRGRRPLDQGRQRDGVRRFQLRVGEVACCASYLPPARCADSPTLHRRGAAGVLDRARHGELEVGLISTATLFGSAFATLAIGRWGIPLSIRRLMLAAAALMAFTGLGVRRLFVLAAAPAGGLRRHAQSEQRRRQPFHAAGPYDDRYRAGGAAHGTFSPATASSAPPSARSARSRPARREWLAASGWTLLDGLRAMFIAMAPSARGVAFYRGCRAAGRRAQGRGAPRALARHRLAAGGAVQRRTPSPADWCSFAPRAVAVQRFDMSLCGGGAFFFWTGLLAAVSQLALRHSPGGSG